MPPADLQRLLKDLHAACTGFDPEMLRHVLMRAPLGYAPKDANIHDIIWQKQEAALVLSVPLAH